MVISDNTNDASSTAGRMRRFAAVRVQLSSTLPSEFRQGIEQLRKWLQNSQYDQETYVFLISIFHEIPALQDNIVELLTEMKQKGSEIAAVTLSNLTTHEQDLMTQADDAYYAVEFDKAISLYQKVLQQEPTNVRAQEQLGKAKSNRVTQWSDRKLPRKAMHYYRRARSYIAASDIKSAMSMLNAAIEEAQDQNMKFPEAEDLLGSQQNLQIASEYKEQANNALQEEKWEEAAELYNRVLKLDATDETVKRNRDSLIKLLETDAILQLLHTNSNDLTIKLNEWGKSGEIRQALEDAEQTTLTSTALYKRIMHFYINDLETQISDLIIKVKNQTAPTDPLMHNQLCELLFKVKTELDGTVQKKAYKKISDLFDKNGNIVAPQNLAKIVLQEIQAELLSAKHTNIMATWPWRITAIGLLIFLASLAIHIQATIPTLAVALQPKNFVIVLAYLAIIGSWIKVARYLSVSEEINWRKSLELLLLRPVIGLGVALIVILAIRAGFLEINVTLTQYVYWAVSVIMGYSQPLVDAILNILDGKISFNLNSQSNNGP